ncbi:MAG: arylesterase, partial [Rhizobiaceae bacterium]
HAIGSKQGMERLIDIVRGHDSPFDGKPPQIVVVAPPAICPTANEDFAAMFPGGEAESKKLAPLYRRMSEAMGCTFFDANSVAKTTPLDGIHLDAQNTRAIGTALAPVVKQMLGL